MKPKHITQEFSRALKSLQAAKILIAEDLIEDAISRSYYAVMHAARAALLFHDVIAESHTALRRLFGLELIKPERLEKEWAAILSREQTQRSIADYDVEVVWNREIASDLIDDAHLFVERIRVYLTVEGVSLDE